MIICYIVDYKESCDTCDSKKHKTPVLCAYVRTRERSGLYDFSQFLFLVLVGRLTWLDLWCAFVCFAASKRLWETTRCFIRNDTLFYKKRHVVLQETIRCFMGVKVKGELDGDHRTVKVWIRWNHMIESWGQIQRTVFFLVGILSLVCSRRSPLDQKQPRNQLLNKKMKSVQHLMTDLG